VVVHSFAVLPIADLESNLKASVLPTRVGDPVGNNVRAGRPPVGIPFKSKRPFQLASGGLEYKARAP
jgi:hypothetical protein